MPNLYFQKSTNTVILKKEHDAYYAARVVCPDVSVRLRRHHSGPDAHLRPRRLVPARGTRGHI